MENHNLDREFVGVLFPGVVKNDEKALACMGGIRNLSNAYSNVNKKRLGLTFQPENPFVKKIYATPKPAAGLLLKVKVKKTKEGNQVKREVVSTVVLGAVKTMFKFESMCDFQYLAIQREGAADVPFKCILEQIVPSGVDSYSFMSQPAPIFLTPPSFTRFDKPIRYTYTDRRYLTDHNPPECDDGESVHSKIRSLRGSFAAQYIFSLTNEMPSGPHESLIKTRKMKEETNPNLVQEYETVKKLFEERPIWSLNLLKFHSKVRGVSLKVIMPCLSVYHKTGPWRTMWVRYGYDPRKDPGARIYQTLDFRLRHGEGIRTLILSREDPGRALDAPAPLVQWRKPASSAVLGDDVPECCVRFRPDTVPTQRHIFYQYCDVQIPEVQDILAVAPLPGHLCHEKRGWLPAATDELARDHMFRYMKNTLLASTNADLSKLEDGSDSEDFNTDDDTRTSEVDQTEDQMDGV